MLRLIARRALSMIPRLLGVLLIVMLLTELMPGDPAEIMAGENATPESIAIIRADLDLDRPIWARFVAYVGDVLQGDLGTSPGTSVAVWDRIAAGLPITLSLLLITMLMAITLGIGAGTLAALRRGRLADRLVTVLTSLLLAIPSFVIGLVLVIQFAVDRPWLPAGGYASIGDGVWEWLRYLILPSLSLALLAAAELARHTRGAIIDTVDRDYVRAARSKGLPERLVIGKHVAKNAATPVVTIAGLQVAGIMGGTIVVERIFAMNGFGSMAVDAVVKRDVVLLQGIVLVAAIGVLLVNLAVDLTYGYLNPAVRS